MDRAMDEVQLANSRADLARRVCPHCGHKGRLVDTQTVKALLAIPLYALRPLRYYFCAEAACPTVYFAEDGAQRFGEEELRVPVYQKHPQNRNPQNKQVPICYCFMHTPQSISDEWRQTGQSTVIETITVGTQSGQCACDLRNPEGRCCLGNVRRFVQQMTQEKA
jgi:Zinc binding domain